MTTPTFRSNRIAGLAQSEIRNMTRECDRLGGINLSQGMCDLPMPEPVRSTAIQAILDGKNTYTMPEGIPSLRAAIASKFKNYNQITVDPLTEVMVTVGSTGSFISAIMALLNPGDGLLLFEPFYAYHRNAARVASLEPQYVALQPPQFAITEAAITAALRPNTKAMVLCTPSNPSGKMLTLAELAIIARVAQQRNLLVITDEIYEYITYDGRRHVSPASLPELKERTVTISGLSKTFSITGWRLGYAAGPATLIGAMNLVNDLFYICAPAPLQHGVVAGFAMGDAFFNELRASYQKKRDRFCAALDEIGLQPIVPEGAYYVLADIGALGYANAKAAAMDLLKKTGVATVPGSAFYHNAIGESLLRFCFAKEDAVLDDAIMRLRTFKK